MIPCPERADELRAALEMLNVMQKVKQSQARLLSRDRRRYARFFEHLPEACVITSHEGTISEANRAAVRLFGVPSGSLCGRPLAAFLECEDGSLLFTRMCAEAANSVVLRQSLTARVQPPAGESLRVVLNMRAAQHRSGIKPELCWLIRPQARQ